MVKLGRWRRLPLPRRVVSELLSAIIVSPLMCFNLRLPCSSLVMVSDASEEGHGACAAHLLTPAGMSATLCDLKASQGLGRDLIGLITIFDGLGSSRRASELLGCEIACHTAVVGSKEEERLLMHAWPDVLVGVDTEGITPKMVRSHALRGLHVVISVLIYSFSLHSCCIHHIIRMLKLIRTGLAHQVVPFVLECKPPQWPAEAKTLLELVAAVQGHPLLICPGPLLGIARPRIFIASWRVESMLIKRTGFFGTSIRELRWEKGDDSMASLETAAHIDWATK